MPTDTQVAELERDSIRVPQDLEPEKPAGRMADPKVRRAVMIAAVLLAAISTVLYFYYRDRVSTDDAQVDGHIVAMAPRIPGTVAEVLIHDNEPVKEGQVLVRIDPRDYQARLDQAKAALQAAEANARGANVGVPWTNETTLSGTNDASAQLVSAQANYRRAQLAYQQASTTDLAFAQAQVAKAQADNDKGQADLERMKPLAAKAEISAQELDAYVAASKNALSGLEAAQQKLAGARQSAEIAHAAMLAADAQVKAGEAAVHEAEANRKQVDIRSADAASADAALAQARASVEAAQLDLSYTTITAPTDGVVTHKSVEVGEIVQPGQALFVLVPLKDVWVTANFKETQLAHVRRGQKAEVHVDMYGETFTGHVDSISSATGARLSLLPPENATGNFVKVVQRIPVKIVLDPIPSGKAVLRPGMNVDATIIAE
ncbi:MAG TPA: HlyD family secretion protein [Terriglobia bacterium]|nr:HlyD family secretion protein [Terriglobia bacterium]